MKTTWGSRINVLLGNGGTMLPDIHIGRDAPVAATLALQLLATFDGPISKFKATLPQYEICKISVCTTHYRNSTAQPHIQGAAN